MQAAGNELTQKGFAIERRARRVLGRVAALAVWAALVAAFAAPQAHASPYRLEHGYVAAAAGRLHEASRIFEELSDTGDVEAQLLAGLALAAQGRVEEAIRFLEAAASQRPDLPLSALVGGVYAAGGRMDEAREAFEAALAVDEGSFLALLGLGRLALESGEPLEALDAYERVLERTQVDAAFVGKARALRALGRLQEAETHLAEGRGWLGNHAPFHVEWGRLLLEMGRLEEACGAFRFARQLDRSAIGAADAGFASCRGLSDST